MYRYENPEREADAQDAYDRYFEALASWSDGQMNSLSGAKLADFVVDGCYNMGRSLDSELAVGLLGDLFTALQATDNRNALPQEVGRAWDRLRARVCITQERARAKAGGY